MTAHVKVNIGSVSHGTMRPEDLIPDFLYELQHQPSISPEHSKLVAEIEERMEADDYFETDNAQEDIDALFEALDTYVPPYFYFGAHPGDGSDYGYWLSESFPEDFDELRVNDLSEVPEDYSGEVLHVNDHGNMTLYSADKGKLTEVWAIV